MLGGHHDGVSLNPVQPFRQHEPPLISIDFGVEGWLLASLRGSSRHLK
jgi:hypothetical protein